MAQSHPESSVRSAVQPINPRPARQWPWPLNLYQTAVGKKWVMAITGVMGIAFLFMHMLGNLKLYLGASAINNYALGLRTLGEPFAPYSTILDAVRAILALAVVVHIHAAFTLWRMNRRAQPKGYQSKRDYIAANWASRTMKWTGPIVLAFIVFHLLDLTWGVANPDFIAGNVYHNVVVSFERWPVAVIYVVANLALGFHLFHGAWALFQSLGINSPQYNAGRKVFAFLLTLAVIGPNVSFPLAVQFGIIH